jgi:LDH2 family malate/lactate/ureidoglycolate dehydrogenase
VSWDAHDGWGHVAALRAMEECVRRARETGACVGVIRNVGHIGRLGYYVDRAAEASAIGFISCSGNESSATMAPWGGREPRLSTNPFAWGFPNPGGDNVVIDVSTTQAARGKVLVAAATGREIPSTWAFDAEGLETTDPHRALPPNGTMAPLGGHKGYALAIAVELLSGGLGGPYPPPESSVFVSAYDPLHLTSEDEYRHAVAELGSLVGSSAPRPGFDAARLPGAGAGERSRRARTVGIRLRPEIWAGVVGAGASVGVDAPDDLR